MLSTALEYISYMRVRRCTGIGIQLNDNSFACVRLLEFAYTQVPYKFPTLVTSTSSEPITALATMH